MNENNMIRKKLFKKKIKFILFHKKIGFFSGCLQGKAYFGVLYDTEKSSTLLIDSYEEAEDLIKVMSDTMSPTLKKDFIIYGVDVSEKETHITGIKCQSLGLPVWPSVIESHHSKTFH